ncbi:Retrovirus-related Pol polyprotein from transposon TNT 1-94, partial [Operophtera brumata]
MASTPAPLIPGENIAAATVSTCGSHVNTTMGNYNIDKLDGMSNYNTWKFCMKMALTLENLWHCIQGNEVVDYQDQRALARICLAVKPHCYQYVQNAKTSKEAWSNLAKVFEDTGLYRRVLLLRQLHRIELTTYSSVTQYVESVMTLVQQLADIGKHIEDGEIAEPLLSGLPTDYDHLVSSLETICLTGSLSSELVRTRLLQEEFRKSEPGATSTAFVSRQTKESKTCTYCKKKGHLKNKCFKLRRDKKSKEDGDKTFVATAFFVNKEEWVIDSGCSTHMCNNKHWLTDFKDCRSVIKIANNEQIHCLGSGDVLLEANDLAHIPSRLSTCGEVVHSSTLLPEQEVQSANVAEVPIDIWHRRLGHLGVQGMQALRDGKANDADDEHYCTGSENEAGSQCSPISDALSERLTSPHLVAPQGEADSTPEPLPSCSTDRPVRTTRSKSPLRYEDYVTDFSLVAQHALPGDPL